MKKLFCLFIFFVVVLSTSAQSIGSFLDFYLGQPISEVKKITNSKYPTASWDEKICTIQNVRIAGELFTKLYLRFDNNILTTGDFSLRQRIPIDISFDYEAASSFLNNCTSHDADVASRLYALYVEKYGKETYNTGKTIVWRGADGKSIKLEFKSEFVNIEGGYLGGAELQLKYEMSSVLGNY